LNADSQSLKSINELDEDEFARPLCAYRDYKPESINQPDSFQKLEESSDIYNLSESSLLESFDSFISSNIESSEL